MAPNWSQDDARRSSKRSRPSSGRSYEAKSQAPKKRNVYKAFAVANSKVSDETPTPTSAAVTCAQATDRSQGSIVAESDDVGDSSKVNFMRSIVAA